MESLVIRIFQAIFKLVVALMISGTLVTVLVDLQRAAFHSKQMGLVSMLQINQQLIGKAK